jgi:cell division protein FtsI (penicillin-binding protein 3)
MAAFPKQDTFNQRLPIVIIMLIAASAVLLFRLVSIQVAQNPEVTAYLENLRDSGYRRNLQLAAARGGIFDRHGETMAVNTLEYRIGISPNLVSDPQRAAIELAGILGLDERELFTTLQSNVQWVQLADRVSAEVGQRIAGLDLGAAITMEPVPRRSYPQGTLASQVIGFVGADLRGYYGVEGYYQQALAGLAREREISNIPFELLGADLEADRGRDIVLTIDRDVQYVAEDELLRAIQETGATRGTVLIMNPRNGEILAMASYPTFDPNAYFNADASVMRNPVISEQFEPGSIMKVITVAAALDTGAITPDFTYNDQGLLEVGGIRIQNWNRAAAGSTSVTRMLVESLNVGAATIGLRMGPTSYYTMMDAFNFGRLTGIDLEGEARGTMHSPGDEEWSEAMFATSTFGQGIAVTPLQMLTAVAAIANDGLMMQPHVVKEVIDGDRIIAAQPSALRRPISAATANTVTEMMVAVVRDGLDGAASIPGYTIAGKTGTAQIPTPGGYDQSASIASFVGFFPADDPQLAILVKLDRPREYWGSVVAAPVFRRIAERLVILLEIPPDNIRYALAAQGGSVNDIQR